MGSRGNRPPRWAIGLLKFLTPSHHEEDVLGDFEESHRNFVSRHGRAIGTLRTALDAVEMGFVVLKARLRRTVPASRRPVDAARRDVLNGAGFSLLDFKLGFRMLAKYPGLTLVAVAALGFAVTLGAASFELLNDVLYPTMPFDQGDRIVELRNRDLTTRSLHGRNLHDLVLWRAELNSVEELGGIQSLRKNISTESGVTTEFSGAELSAKALGIPRVPPFLGRLLSEADELADAPRVLILGHHVWKSRFGADPDVIGKTVRLAGVLSTIVGVMPEGFAWPRAHSWWAPLRESTLDHQRGEGPNVQIVGRLSAGVTLEMVQAELSVLGSNSARDYPESHRQLRPEVVRYGTLGLNLSRSIEAGFLGLNALCFLALLVLICSNIGVLLFARTAAREGEIIIRRALGASRGRIVMQLLTESVVLCFLAGLIGLVGAKMALEWLVRIFSTMEDSGGGLVGFWFLDGLSNLTLIYAFAFMLFAGLAAGILPALKVSGMGLRVAVGSGLTVGRFWTVVIVAQIALTVIFVPIVVMLGVQTAEIRSSPYGFEAERFLFAQIRVDGDLALQEPGDSAYEAYVDSYRELKRRLLAEPGVLAVTVAEKVPGPNHPLRIIEFDRSSSSEEVRQDRRIQSIPVDLDFFETLGASILSGRSFKRADLDSENLVAVVNEDFVRVVLGGRNALGRRFAFVGRGQRGEASGPNPGPWYEIVGVVKQIQMQNDPDLRSGAGIYRLLGPETAYPVSLAVKVGGDPMTFAPRLKVVADGVSSNLLLGQVRPMRDSAWETVLVYETWFYIVLVTGGLGLLLALAGIYAVLSFTVSRRTREIGVRVALGANRPSVVWSIFNGAYKQVVLGIGIGGSVVGVAVVFGAGKALTPTIAGFFSAYILAMLLVCSLACIVPAARALSIQPTEALRRDG